MAGVRAEAAAKLLARVQASTQVCAPQACRCSHSPSGMPGNAARQGLWLGVCVLSGKMQHGLCLHWACTWSSGLRHHASLQLRLTAACHTAPKRGRTCHASCGGAQVSHCWAALRLGCAPVTAEGLLQKELQLSMLDSAVHATTHHLICLALW